MHEIELLNIPSDTRALALHPSLPIQLNLPVAPIRLTAFISSATSWSDAKRITPEIKRNRAITYYVSKKELVRLIQKTTIFVNI